MSTSLFSFLGQSENDDLKKSILKTNHESSNRRGFKDTHGLCKLLYISAAASKETEPMLSEDQYCNFLVINVYICIYVILLFIDIVIL